MAIEQANLDLNLSGPVGEGVTAQIKEKIKETDFRNREGTDKSWG